MARDPILLTPGPTPVPPEIREVMSRPIPHHRTPEFQAVLKEVAAGLKRVFRTEQDVLILTSSGTGAMEAAVVNLLSPGETAFVIQGGKFGERWAEICRGYGIRVVPFNSPWGRPLDLNRASEEAAKDPSIRAVFSTLCETSTGVAYDIRGLRQAIGPKPLLVVDAISGLGVDPFEMDGWGVDAAVSGSQKGLMLPPGLAFIALSPRGWEAAERSGSPRYYFDLRLAREAWKEADTPFTPGISLIVGLAESLKRIQAGGLDQVLELNRRNAEAVRQAVKGLGLELYTDPSCASNGVTSVKVPAGIDGKELLKRLRKEEGIVLAGGQGKELAGKVFRIATMGAIGPEEIRAGLAALEKVLVQMGWKAPALK
ncbi:MAG: alanine--glyoxylate aminotransferase family protein [Candidatus Omnitrophica bacterium]|nr:alanine--glyoxylate aminotransferase family protein [Candidatus Omnitrophota bacterium]